MGDNSNSKKKNKNFSSKKIRGIEDSNLVESIRCSIEGPECFARIVRELVERGLDP